MTIMFILLSLISLLLSPSSGYSQAISDYVILTDIGPYRPSQPKELIPGIAPVGGPRVKKYPGIVGGPPFTEHTDTEYELRYLGSNNYPSPTVKVIQHTANEADKWLIHQLERHFRGDSDRLGLAAKNVFMSNIRGNTVFCMGVSGWHYMWLSSSKVIVEIESYDAEFSKPEPLDFVQAYLSKFPSIISTTFKLSSTHNVEWIKDEIDRLLWLGELDLAKIQPDDPKLSYKIKSVVDDLSKFLDYREKYFGLSARKEKLNLLDYLSKKDETSLKTKYQDYKKWWTSNKGNEINL